jgi:hypothetical protein
MAVVRAHALTVEGPRGWDLHVYRRATDDAATAYPVMHAATFALPSNCGDFGVGAVERMSAEDVLVVLFEYEPGAAHTPLFRRTERPRPRVTDFYPQALQRTVPGQSGAQWFFTENDRAFSLYIVMGSHQRRARRIPEVHALLDGLTVHRGAG